MKTELVGELTQEKSRYKIKGCVICGSKFVLIRGRYPNCKKRKICPTCAYEKLEQINEISSNDYGKAYQSHTQ